MTSICKRICGCCYPIPIDSVPKHKKSSSMEFAVAIGNTKKRHQKLASTEMVSARTMIRWDSTSFNKYVKDRKENG